MKLPSMQRAAIYSFIAHVAFLILAIIFSRSTLQTEPTIYTVKLVEQTPKKSVPPRTQPSPKPDTGPSEPQNQQKVAPKPPEPENRQRVAPKKQPTPASPSIDKLKAQRLEELQQRLHQKESAKEQKERERQKQEGLERIRKEAEARSAAAQAASNEAEYGRLASEYEITLHNIFYSSWTFPDIAGVYNMQSTVLITVYADGNVNINKILKPSGNRVFDRSVLKAITDAGRVPPPPFGRTVEIEVLFKPEKG